MKTDPPTGDDLTTLLTSARTKVLSRTSAVKPRKRPWGFAALVVASVGVLALGGAGTAIATSYLASAFIEIPHSTNRPSDPPPPTDYDQETNSHLEAHEASLGQLWAEINSYFATPDGTYSDVTTWTSDAMTDFATAITDRCYPLRTAEEVSELEQLRVSYEAQVGQVGFDLARVYFERATALCM
jgi:hypothetical protein